MKRWLRRRIWVHIERADWMRTPGRQLEVQAGPFLFGVVTADAGGVSFSIDLPFGRVGWEWQGLERG